MSLPPLDFWRVLIAALPLLVVLYLMIGRNWGGAKAGPAGWLAAVVLALVFFGANLPLLLVAFGRSLLLAFFVLYIIWMALLLYHVVNDAGAIAIIGRQLPRLARDRPAQALLLGWVFGSFLQGASGFGVPAAVVAPLLVGLGFPATPAVVIALLGHAWAVTFGSLGSSFYSMMAATGQPGELLAGPTALLLAICCLACGIGVLWAAGRGAALRRRWLQLLVVGLVMGGVQWGLAVAGLWSLAAFGAGIAGLLVIAVDLRFSITDFGFRKRPAVDEAALDEQARPLLIRAVVPYLILTVIIVIGQLALEEPLAWLTLNPTFPAVETSFGWRTAAGPGRSISIFGHAGALLLYASLLSYGWFHWRQPLVSNRIYNGRQIVRKTVKGSVKPTVGIVTMVAMAVTMEHAGMTRLLAQALSQSTGALFPFLSPFIGALGAFMTGSNTNSNVVFGQLQQETAAALKLAIPLILAAQTAGGAIGSLFAPAKVIVGCSTVKGAEDGRVLKSATAYGLAIIALVGVVTWLAAMVFD